MTILGGVSALKGPLYWNVRCVVGIFEAAPNVIFMQSWAPSGAAESERKALHPPPTEMLEMRSICLNLILVSGVHTAPPTGNDKLKLLVAAVGWHSLRRRPDSTALDCFLSHWKAGVCSMAY